MRIISASRRTDIPAFYSAWFLRRLQAGFCHWINPFGGQVYRVSLLPHDVLAIVFWTRWPAPLLPHLPSLRQAGYRFYVHVTINGYGPPLETHSPPREPAIDACRRLADAIGPDLVHWRYDPIILSPATPTHDHIRQFEALSSRLQGSTRRCYVSFIDIYGKTARNLRRAGIDVARPPEQSQRDLIGALQHIAAARGMSLYTCCEPALADAATGAQRAHCIDSDLVRRLCGADALAIKPAPSRAGCGCVAATDIGAYDTCVFGCAYCYATNSRQVALQRLRDHDPDDTVLWRPPALRGVDLSTRETYAR